MPLNGKTRIPKKDIQKLHNLLLFISYLMRKSGDNLGAALMAYAAMYLELPEIIGNARIANENELIKKSCLLALEILSKHKIENHNLQTKLSNIILRILGNLGMEQDTYHKGHQIFKEVLRLYKQVDFINNSAY
jgi:hypothetical protein